MITLRELARLAGVSATTVSKALRHDPKISAQRRLQLIALAERNGYRPHPALAAWMSHVRDLRRAPVATAIAYVSAHPLDELSRQRDGWPRRYFAGAAAMAERLGYRCTALSLQDYGRDWNRLFKVLHHRGVRGVAIGPLAGHAPPPKTLPALSVATIEMLDSPCAVDWAATDHFTGMTLAIREARVRGHRRVGYIRSELSAPEHERWRAAFSLFQTDQPPALRLPPLDPRTQPAEAVVAWCRRYRPTVVITSDPRVITRLSQAGLTVPRDVSVITLDRTPTDGSATAGIDQRMDEVGATVIRLLAMKIEHNEAPASSLTRSVLVQPSWCDGESLQPISRTRGETVARVAPVSSSPHY